MGIRTENAGFSMIEVIVVIALTALVAGVGVAMSYSSIARANVVQERDLLVSLLLSGARARSLSNVHETSHGIRIDNTAHEYILFEGPDFTSDPASHVTTPFIGGADTSITSSGGTDIVFEQRSGNVTNGVGIVTLTNNGMPSTFTINDAGRIDW